MLSQIRNVHKHLWLYKNSKLLRRKATTRLTLPIVSLSRPYMAYMGTERSVVMITAPGRISNHILSGKMSVLLFFRQVTNGERENQLFAVDSHLESLLFSIVRPCLEMCMSRQIYFIFKLNLEYFSMFLIIYLVTV